MSEPSCGSCVLKRSISGEAGWTELMGLRKRPQALGLDRPLGIWPRCLKSRLEVPPVGGTRAAPPRVARGTCLGRARATPGPGKPGQSCPPLGQPPEGSQSVRRCGLSAL